MSSPFPSLLLIAFVLLASTVDDVTASGPCGCNQATKSMWELQISEAGVFLSNRQLIVVIAVSATAFTFLATFCCLISFGYSCDFLLRFLFICCRRRRDETQKPAQTNMQRSKSNHIGESLTSFHKNEFFEDCFA